MAAAASASSDDLEASESDFEPDEETQAQTEVASSHLSYCNNRDGVTRPQHSQRSSCMEWRIIWHVVSADSCAPVSIVIRCTSWQDDEMSTDAGLTEEEEAEEDDKEEKPARKRPKTSSPGLHSAFKSVLPVKSEASGLAARARIAGQSWHGGVPAGLLLQPPATLSFMTYLHPRTQWTSCVIAPAEVIML